MKKLIEVVSYWGLFAFVVYGVYLAADSGGYIPHTVETSISAQDNWLVGESKECTSPVLDGKTTRYIHLEDGYVALFVACDDGPQHAMKATFYGQLNQPGHKLVQWRCTRKSGGFTCKQRGTIP